MHGWILPSKKKGFIFLKFIENQKGANYVSIKRRNL